MIDSHCHLTDPRLAHQREDVLQRARQAGVLRMFTIGTSADDGEACVALCGSHSFVRCAVGIHPNHVDESSRADLPRIEAIAAAPQVLAVGEMGLDYHHSFSSPGLQRQVFEAQIEIAGRVKKPVIIHCREAVDDALAVLRAHSGIKGVFHCFTGTIEEARRILDVGFYLGFTGVITFKNSDALREVVRFCPMDRLLVETDSPYLTPEPMRKQKVNEPAMVMHVAAEVARVRGMKIGEADRRTSENVAHLLGWTLDELPGDGR